MKTVTLFSLLHAAAVTAQHNTSTANGCVDGFYPGTDTVIFTTPYTYAQVISIIGDYRNITWSGSPYNTVTLNGTDNSVGTARFYDLGGSHVVETIRTYSKPADGPYEEIHAVDLVTIPAANLSFYSDYDGTTATPICNGLATIFNFTINFCSNNPSLAALALHQLHLTDAQTVGVYLGGQNFSSCEVLSGTATNGTISNGTATNGTATATPLPPIVTASGTSANLASISTIIMVGGLLAWFGM